MNDWVSVKERLPNDNPRKPYMVCYKSGVSGGRSVLAAVYSGGAWRFLNPRDKSHLPERVTHWMPFPRLPRKDKT